MLNKFSILALTSIALLSLNACTSLKYKDTAAMDLKEIAVDSALEQKDRDSAINALTSRADKGDTQALSAIIALTGESNELYRNLSSYIESAVIQQKTIIAQAISDKMVYPDSLNAETITTGIVVEVDENGNVTRAQVARSSGDPNMDNASTEAAEAASPFSLIDNVHEHLGTMHFLIDSTPPSKEN